MSQAMRYRPLECERVTGFSRHWPLAKQEMMALFRSKWGVALFFFCLFPSLGRLVMMMIMFGVVDFGPRGLVGRMGQNLPEEFNPERAAFYFETALSTMPGMVFFLMITSVVVARSIARDRATNGLELYWTRGITPWGYVFAKWLGGFLLTSSMMVVMPFVLWCAAVLLAEDWSLLMSTSGQMAMGLLGMAIMTAIWTGIGTLLSAVASTANLAMVMWTMLLVGSSSVGFILSKVLGVPELKSCLSFWDAGRVILRDIASLPQRIDVSVAGAYAMLLSVATLFGLLAWRRMRVVEALQ